MFYAEYWVHNDFSSKGLYVKNKDGGDYEGWCRPGASYYPDFLNSEARDYFAQQYMLDVYKNSNLDCYTWNDMNEPSVFNGPEVSNKSPMFRQGPGAVIELSEGFVDYGNPSPWT